MIGQPQVAEDPSKLGIPAVIEYELGNGRFAWDVSTAKARSIALVEIIDQLGFFPSIFRSADFPAADLWSYEPQTSVELLIRIQTILCTARFTEISTSRLAEPEILPILEYEIKLPAAASK